MNKLHTILISLLIAGSTAASWLVWENRQTWLPEKVPVHWGIDFTPDKWAPRDDMFWYLFAVPIGMVGITLLLAALIYWFSPRGFEPAKANPQLNSFIILLIVGLFAALHAVILMGYVTQQMPVTSGIMGVVFLFFILLGNILGKIQRNFWIGIRTPWTLANNQVWEKTHRLGAWTFVGAGVIGLLSLFVTSLVPMPIMIGCWIGLLTLAALVPVIYSLVYYKQLERSGKLDEPIRA
ncbi:MAG TPA: SdpI family protein [Gemmatales bacterium]|nr:SdpI family protein [Gemmatales bacterium]